MTYKILTIDSKKYVIRFNDDGSETGCTEGPVDYEEYLEWVADGNTAPDL